MESGNHLHIPVEMQEGLGFRVSTQVSGILADTAKGIGANKQRITHMELAFNDDASHACPSTTGNLALSHRLEEGNNAPN